MIATPSVELTYSNYQERQRREVTREGLFVRSVRLAHSDKFRSADGQWRPQSYPGHAVVSMVSATPDNDALQDRLIACQRDLRRDLAAPGLFYPLPPASFHQTLANTLSGERHHQRVVEPGLAAEFPRRVTDVFADFTPPLALSPLGLRMIGVALFGSAIGALGIFENEGDFCRVLLFRDQFYGHPTVQALGVTRTRPFIGHVTLGYLGRTPDDDMRRRLVNAVDRVNNEHFATPIDFILPFAELRSYEHLAEFRPLPGLAQYRL